MLCIVFSFGENTAFSKHTIIQFDCTCNSLGFIFNNYLTPRVEPDDKGGYYRPKTLD